MIYSGNYSTKGMKNCWILKDAGCALGRENKSRMSRFHLDGFFCCRVHFNGKLWGEQVEHVRKLPQISISEKVAIWIFLTFCSKCIQVKTFFTYSRNLGMNIKEYKKDYWSLSDELGNWMMWFLGETNIELRQKVLDF